MHGISKNIIFALSVIINYRESKMETSRLGYRYDDGGRSQAGYKGIAGDCVVRAISIATGLDYKWVYDTVAGIEKRSGFAKSARNGVYTKSNQFRDFMESLGFRKVSVKFGAKEKMHMVRTEIPQGRVICRISKHYTAVIDHVICDIYDPSRNGNRMVYYYWEYKPVK